MSSTTPIIDTLNKYAKKKRVSFCMPGHKNGININSELKKNFFKYDVTELRDTLRLHNPNEAMKEAKRALANFYGAKDSYFLVGGSTSGIFAMLASVAKRGDTVIVNRACHISVINACVSIGIKPVFLAQSIIDKFSVPGGISQTEIIRVLDENPDAKAVLLTSPSYYGICTDIEFVGKIVHARGIPLLVDEAHGAHFNVDRTIFPTTAVLQGADLTVQSAHKTLSAANQAAYLHYNSDIVSRARLEKMLEIYQTSSPSYPIIASADCARAELDSRAGRTGWKAVFENCEILRESVKSKTDLDFTSRLLNGKFNISNVDETRIVMNFSAYSITGFRAAEILSEEYGIETEMADLYNVVGIATAANRARDFARLSDALIKMCADLKKSSEEPIFPAVPIPEMAMLPQDAFFGNTKKVRLEDAIGEVAATTVIAYPPATPIICSGERITRESMGYIIGLRQMKAEIMGLSGNSYITVADV